MKILVAVAKYTTPDTKVYQSFVRQRNIFYKKNGIDISVLNFYAKNDYLLDDIPVYSLETYKNRLVHEHYDLLVCHAPNLRNHFFFLKRYEVNFPKIVFIFHGHEVLMTNQVYSAPYSYIKQASFWNRKSQDLYDFIKLKLWHSYYPKLAYKSHFLFVSNWMYDEFIKWTKIPSTVIEDRYSITYNSIGASFEADNYDPDREKIYDFITIRGDLDGSKYCIDLVNRIAKSNPHFNFLVVGKGTFFSHNEKAANIEWLDRQLSHQEIIGYLNKSRCALMLTRTDAQGLMMCEMASFGIPLITSNISVCSEVFDSFSNVRFIDNNQKTINIGDTFQDLISGVPYIKNTKFFASNTMQKEIELFKLLVNK